MWERKGEEREGMKGEGDGERGDERGDGEGGGEQNFRIFFGKQPNFDFPITAKYSHNARVGHCVLFCSVGSVLFRSLKGTFRSFFEFLASYETKKNVPFFSVFF